MQKKVYYPFKIVFSLTGFFAGKDRRVLNVLLMGQYSDAGAVFLFRNQNAVQFSGERFV